MNPLAVLGRAASLFVGMVAAEWQAAAATFPSWPDGEEPVAAEEPRFFPGYDVYATVPQSSAAPEAAAVEVPTPESALPQPGVGHPTYPVIDPGELRDAATALRCYRASAYPPRRIVDGVLALSHRLDEYADALTAFDNAQQ